MRVLKTAIPVDDAWHRIEGCDAFDRIVHVGNQFGEPGIVTVWWMTAPAGMDYGDWGTPITEARVFGTGQEIPDDSLVVGSVVANGALVWHLGVRCSFEG